jgi:uncharacterized membrane protein YhhN
MAAITLLAFLIIAGINWIAVAQQPEEQRSVEYVTKPAALVALLLFAATGRDPSLWLVAALGFSLLGDVYLMLPGNFFTAGLTAFLVAHLAYITDFDAGLGLRVLWFVIAGGISYFLVARRILGCIEDQKMRPAVGLYIAVICYMVGSAIASASIPAAAGALLFLTSDTLLAWDRFVEPSPNSRVMVMATYHLGQLLLVVALRS